MEGWRVQWRDDKCGMEMCSTGVFLSKEILHTVVSCYFVAPPVFLSVSIKLFLFVLFIFYSCISLTVQPCHIQLLYFISHCLLFTD